MRERSFERPNGDHIGESRSKSYVPAVTRPAHLDPSYNMSTMSVLVAETNNRGWSGVQLAETDGWAVVDQLRAYRREHPWGTVMAAGAVHARPCMAVGIGPADRLPAGVRMLIVDDGSLLEVSSVQPIRMGLRHVQRLCDVRYWP